MRSTSFSGGLKLPVPGKLEYKQLESVPPPSRVILPLKQYSGRSCELRQKKGTEVKQGAIIGISPHTVIHATIAGKVSEINKNFRHHSGETITAITLEANGARGKDYSYLQNEQIMGKILYGGLNDFSPESESLLSKISRAQEAKVHTLILNCLEEMYIQGCMSSLLASHAEDVFAGLKLLQELTGAKEVYIGVYDKQYQSISALQKNKTSFNIVPLQPKHPQHAEQLLISSLTGQEYPMELKPEELGLCVFNLQTAYALARIVNHSEPYINKALTVASSDQPNTRNLEVRIGTPISDILEYLKLDPQKIGKVVFGGPMTGRAIYDLETPVTREVHQIYLQKKDEVFEPANQICIKCGMCVKVCPMRLMPFLISGFSEKGYYENAERNNIFSCIECGCCAYVCPSQIPLVQWIQTGKAVLRSQKE